MTSVDSRSSRLPDAKVPDSAALLDAIVGALPVGVSVQDDEGRLLVLNEAAALAIGDEAVRLRGSIPFGVRSAGIDQISRRRERFLKHLRSGEAQLRERVVMIGNQPHTLLVTGKPAVVGGKTMLVSTSIDITERKRFEDELTFRAFHDQLTGLPNRALMRELVDAALLAHSRGGMFALAFIDLDNFKSINDYYSHAIGDALLCAVATRIAGQMRAGDTLARISGDEFLLLVNPLDDPEQLPRLMDRVVGTMKEPFFIEGHEVLTSATVGVSIFPRHGQTYDMLRRCADNAMYRAKSDRKGSARCFDVAMGDALTARMDMEQRLRTAVRDRHFRTVFQPKVEIGTGKIVGFEALVRWVEVGREVSSPGLFIALATELGLIDAITNFVLDDVVSSLPLLRSRFGAHISISINIAARQAGDVALMDALIDRLHAEGIARAVVLELTEDALIATQRFQRQVLPRLREMGVRVSIDDFGTGFSSLSTLADITADEVKVDRAFISSIHERPRSQGILKAIESLCQALRIEVVAEGVETELELAYLEGQTSIQFVQGYYFGKPQYIESLLHVGLPL
ncbi:putative bifunctional diguanylate cyclase/phosphodiesterase [Paraburkholderia saeva]|uniref:putative bifunctional diguanylate cyclase/phosphodiesterase n=1 Tax=Paraburkholderia saeva TaxID=2777537 RepID=UPI001D9A5B8C|nr:EAL domain-containing protein [Paraburkholderia saeva]CAG4917395.1 Cyclic di-GMP phosphodiesterase PdeR [Paraburkholderia saeva]